MFLNNIACYVSTQTKLLYPIACICRVPYIYPNAFHSASTFSNICIAFPMNGPISAYTAVEFPDVMSADVLSKHYVADIIILLHSNCVR